MQLVEKINNTVKNDELFSGVEVPVFVENISVKGGAEFSRGCILGGASGVYEPVKAAADAKKVLMVAAEDVVAPSEGTIATAYISGIFNAAKLSTGDEAISPVDLKEPLRQVNIYVEG